LPAGPMTSGISNDEKAEVRMKFAAGEVGRAELMASEMAAYHGPGTCTFYGTANDPRRHPARATDFTSGG